MTLPAFQELARVAAAVSEAHLEEQYLREGLELVIWGNLQAVGPAQPSQLTCDQILLIRKSFCSYARVSAYTQEFLIVERNSYEFWITTSTRRFCALPARLSLPSG